MGTLTPKETGGTPEWTGRTWGDLRGRRSGRQTGSASLRQGRSGGAGWRDSPGVTGDKQRATALLTAARGACWAPRPVPCPPKPPSGHMGSWGHRREAGEIRSDRWEGPSGRNGRGAEGICPDIYRTFHPKVAEYTSFSSTHGTFSRIDHILGHKSSLGKLKKIEIVTSIFSEYNAMRLEINYRKKTVKNTNTWRLNSDY